jgi:hypothetical protein
LCTCMLLHLDSMLIMCRMVSLSMSSRKFRSSRPSRNDATSGYTNTPQSTSEHNSRLQRRLRQGLRRCLSLIPCPTVADPGVGLRGHHMLATPLLPCLWRRTCLWRGRMVRVTLNSFWYVASSSSVG